MIGGAATNTLKFVHDHIMFLGDSKYFAGIMMILLNVGSKFIPIKFSRSMEEYLKMTVTMQLLLFSMAYVATRHIYTALVLTAVFTVLNEHLFNEESPLCVVPHKCRVLPGLLPTAGQVTEQELNAAIGVMEKVKRSMVSQADPSHVSAPLPKGPMIAPPNPLAWGMR